MSAAPTLASRLVDALSNEFPGRAIGPADPSYDDARAVFMGGPDRRPAVIVQPIDAAEVARVVLLARETGLELAVRSGGHSLARHSVSDGGIVLDLSRMRGLDVDLRTRTAWAQTGLTAGAYTAALADHGLATGFGDTDSVGVGGLTLGGGIGFLVRKHGLTIDNLLAAQVVTADGQVLLVDAANHADLFWAIRGGGGNFGVATRLRYRLHEVGAVVGGVLILPASPDVFAGTIAAAQAAPEELTAFVDVMLAPPMPFIPRDVHGQPVVMVTPCFAGPVDAADRAFAPFRAVAQPLVDALELMPYPRIYHSGDGYSRPLVAIRTTLVDGVDRALAEIVLDHVRRSAAAISSVEFRVLGGAVARVPDEVTAFAHRRRGMLATALAMYGRPAEREQHETWAADIRAALGGTGAYVNFLADEGRDRVREAYPAPTWQRLAEVKRRYDPTNLFRLNQNVPPA